jgi:hypothetical protein
MGLKRCDAHTTHTWRAAALLWLIRHTTSLRCGSRLWSCWAFVWAVRQGARGALCCLAVRVVCVCVCVCARVCVCVMHFLLSDVCLPPLCPPQTLRGSAWLSSNHLCRAGTGAGTRGGMIAGDGCSHARGEVRGLLAHCLPDT